GKDEGEGHLQVLRREHDLAPLHPVGDHAAEERKEQHRSGAEKGIDTEQKRGAGQRVDHPRLSHGLHPGPGRGSERPDPDQPEIAILQRAEGPAETARARLRRRFRGLFLRKRGTHRAIFNLAAVACVCAWQMATASASEASAETTIRAQPGRRMRTIFATCVFSAPPYPTTELFTDRGEYSNSGNPAVYAASRTTPRACASWIRLFMFCPAKGVSTATAAGEVRAITDRNASWICPSRRASSAPRGVRIDPCSTSTSRPRSASMTPKPVVMEPGSTPRMRMTRIMKAEGRSQKSEGSSFCLLPSAFRLPERHLVDLPPLRPVLRLVVCPRRIV